MRKSKVIRKTKETNITVDLNLDGSGKTSIKTGVGFLNHMLELFAYHGLFDMKVNVKKQDLDVDLHHTNEDVALTMGEAFKAALKTKKGINRFGTAFVPMDESLAKVRVVIDVSGRPSAHFNIQKKITSNFIKTPTLSYDINLTKHFFNSFCISSGINLHIDVLKGEDFHHTLEAVFKAFGRAMFKAVKIEAKRKGKTPSTKGRL